MRTSDTHLPHIGTSAISWENMFYRRVMTLQASRPANAGAYLFRPFGPSPVVAREMVARVRVGLS